MTIAPEIESSISEHSVFPSVYVWLKQQGAWKPHPYNSHAQMLFYYKCLIWQHPHNFETKIIAFFHQLVLSTISKVSTLASKHLCSFAHWPYHARPVSTVAYCQNTHHPHHFRL